MSDDLRRRILARRNALLVAVLGATACDRCGASGTPDTGPMTGTAPSARVDTSQSTPEGGAPELIAPDVPWSMLDQGDVAADASRPRSRVCLTLIPRPPPSPRPL
jgi:hypothetical protein